MRRDATRVAAGGLAGAHREGRSESVSAKHARLRLRLPSRSTDRRGPPAGRLFRGPVSISPLASVSSRRSRLFFRVRERFRRFTLVRSVPFSAAWNRFTPAR